MCLCSMITLLSGLQLPSSRRRPNLNHVKYFKVVSYYSRHFQWPQASSGVRNTKSLAKSRVQLKNNVASAHPALYSQTSTRCQKRHVPWLSPHQGQISFEISCFTTQELQYEDNDCFQSFIAKTITNSLRLAAAQASLPATLEAPQRQPKLRA